MLLGYIIYGEQEKVQWEGMKPSVGLMRNYFFGQPWLKFSNWMNKIMWECVGVSAKINPLRTLQVRSTVNIDVHLLGILKGVKLIPPSTVCPWFSQPHRKVLTILLINCLLSLQFLESVLSSFSTTRLCLEGLGYTLYLENRENRS